MSALVAVLSHVLAAVFPFLAWGVLQSAGPLKGGLMVYAMGLILLTPLYVVGRRTGALRSIRTQIHQNQRLRVALMLYACGAVSYYQGLSLVTGNPAEFGFIAKMSSALLVVSGVVFLQEKARIVSLLGVVIAFGGALLVAKRGSIPLPALGYALAFLGCTVAAETLIKTVLKTTSAFVVVYARWLVVTVVMFLAVGGAIALKGAAPVSTTVSAAVDPALVFGAGSLLVAIFVTRYMALKRLPLWLYAGLGPVELAASVVLSSVLQMELSLAVFVGLTLIVLGESVAMGTRASASAQKTAAAS